LRARRRSRRRRVLIALSILFLLLCAGIIYELQQSAVRIANIEVYGADASLAAYAREAMQGSYFGIIPRDSTFFFPASNIRSNILADHPDIAAVSIFRKGLTGISIKPDERAPIARWCGLAPTEGVEEYCYVFDASGFIFAAAATSTETINSFTLYAPLQGETLEPLRATIAQIERLPAAFDLARQLDTLGSPVTHLMLRGDEVDDYLASGTRITYVLGNEQNAFTALVSARENMNLADGSVDYVDLRFDGKVYLKQK
jgi:hypothetical protein